MPERRMFAKTIVLSDAFLDMPTSARCLYFTLGMFADDDGFINNPRSIMRQCGTTEDDLKILLAKKFLLTFEDGVIVIKHWKIHNYIQKDRYVPTKYTEHKAELNYDENNAYTFKEIECIQNVSKMDTQVSIDKDKLIKDSKELDQKEIIKEKVENTCEIEKEEYNENKVSLTEIAKFIDENELDHLIPTKEFIHINNFEIEDWRTYLKEKEEKIK